MQELKLNTTALWKSPCSPPLKVQTSGIRCIFRIFKLYFADRFVFSQTHFSGHISIFVFRWQRRVCTNISLTMRIFQTILLKDLYFRKHISVTDAVLYLSTFRHEMVLIERCITKSLWWQAGGVHHWVGDWNAPGGGPLREEDCDGQNLPDAGSRWGAFCGQVRIVLGHCVSFCKNQI